VVRIIEIDRKTAGPTVLALETKGAASRTMSVAIKGPMSAGAID
jgi:hypothetical protein